MTKIIGYTALHYGTSYLGYAIRSIIDHIDEYHVLYVAQGSHGHRTNITCPDSRGHLYAIAREAASYKLHWHDGDWTQEGQHRDAIHEIVPDADVVLVLDADEIWGDRLAPFCISYAMAIEDCDKMRVPIIHYWRSFRRCVLHDPAFPIRIIRNIHGSNTITVDLMDKVSPYIPPINHMGYAIRPEMMFYKWQTHGHRGEMKSFDTWFNDVFLKNRQVDCHPIGSEFWNPESVEPLDYMPEFMSSHPYFGLNIIE